MSSPPISRRKTDHIEVAASGRAAARKVTTLLQEVALVHQALPERDVEEVDLSVRFADHTLSAPLLISGMTGGTPEATAINRALAKLANERNIAFGVGSQRAMSLHPDLVETYRVRDVAKDVFLIGNIGAVQARQLGVEGVRDLVAAIDANAMAIHLNPAQELIQADGDRDFRGIIEMLGRLSDNLGVPVIAKETGCGISHEAAQAIANAGVGIADVAGAGGTSWIAVEAERTTNDDARALGNELWDWGIPTAVSTVACVRAGLTTIASGGVRSGSDVCRALALGATLGGVAAPILKSYLDGGAEEAGQHLDRIITAIRTTTFLAGAGTVEDLVRAPRHLGPNLRAWLDDLSLR